MNTNTTALNPNLDYTPEVRDALHTGRAVVALESTIISHGMPYPQNVPDRPRGGRRGA